MANNNDAAERKRQEERQDAAAQKQRDHDKAQLAQQHANAVALENMRAAEAQKERDFSKKQSAKERASQYSSQNMRAPKDLSQDQTGGAASRYADKFGAGNNTYKGKGFQQFDFTGGKVAAGR